MTMNRRHVRKTVLIEIYKNKEISARGKNPIFKNICHSIRRTSQLNKICYRKMNMELSEFYLL